MMNLKVVSTSNTLRKELVLVEERKKGDWKIEI